MKIAICSDHAGFEYYLKSESAVASEVGTNTAREYANWGGEFVDDAFTDSLRITAGYRGHRISRRER